MRILTRSTILCLLLLCMGSVCWAGLKDNPTIAVLPYANKAAVSSQISLSDAGLVSEFVIEELLETGRFDVVERDQIAAVAKEQKMALTGLVDANTAVQMGGLLGAKYFVIGSVTGLSLKRSEASYENSSVGKVGGNKITVIANVTARIVDVATGRIVLAAHGTGESSSGNAEFILKKTWTEDIGTTNTISGVSSTISNDGVISGTASSIDGMLGTVTDSSGITSTNNIEGVISSVSSENVSSISDGSISSISDSSVSGSSSVVSSGNTVTRSTTHRVVIGSTEVSQVQVRNSLYKAVVNLVNGSHGILAKIDGRAKKAKV